MTSPIYNPGQPHLLPIPGGFPPGRIAHITGTLNASANSVVLKFQTGPYGDPNDDVGLCIYGRVAENVFGCNAFTRAAGWGVETAVPMQGLIRSQPFEITILCDPTTFKIALNRQHLTEFNHRLDPVYLSHLNVTSGPNDLVIDCLWIEDPSAPPAHVSSPGAQPYPSYNQNPQAHSGSYPPGQQYHGSPSGHGSYAAHGSHGTKDKGLMGMIGGAGAAVAGALGASHLMGKSKGYPSPSHHYGGYPGHSSHGSGGGILNKALGIGGGVMAAKTAKKGLGGGGKALKYGLPLAGAGLGGYMLSKGVSHGFGGYSSGSDDDWFGGSFSDDCCSD